MTQQEFETLFGRKVQVSEFEVINAMYMLDENETKQQFVERFKKMTLPVMLSNFAQVLSNLREQHSQELAAMSDRDCKVLNKLREHEKELEGANEYLSNQLADLQQELHDLLVTIAVASHSYDTNTITDIVREKMGTLEYYKTLNKLGCAPTKVDLEMFIKAMEEK